MSNSLKDNLSTMISSISSATKSSNFGDACNWAAQAVQATATCNDDEARRLVNTAVTGVLVKATVETRTAVMRGIGLFGKLSHPVDAIVRCTELLADMAKGANRELALAQALVLGGYAKQLATALKPHTTSIYVHTDAPTLDAFLTTLGEILKESERLTTERVSAGLTVEEQNRLAATALSNARGALSAIFSEKFSDWDRARVLTKHAFVVVADNQSALKAEFDAIEDALAKKNYKSAAGKLKALEAALGGGD